MKVYIEHNYLANLCACQFALQFDYNDLQNNKIRYCFDKVIAGNIFRIWSEALFSNDLKSIISFRWGYHEPDDCDSSLVLFGSDSKSEELAIKLINSLLSSFHLVIE